MPDGNDIEEQLGPVPPLALSKELLRAIMNLTSRFTSDNAQNFQLLRDAIAQHLFYMQQENASLLHELENNEGKVTSFINYAMQHPDEMRHFAF
jgi:hypothetical protein